MGNALEITAETVELDATDGVAFIEQASPLTRLHYFDGKFLRADALTLEQDYHRYRVRLANIAGGWGAVHGFGVTLNGGRLDVGAGLAVTAAGSFALATADFHAQLDELLRVAAPAPPPGSAAFADCLEPPKAGVMETAALAIYEITVGPVEGLCGNEPVYGKLCETACASDSRHPYWREGVVLRLRPISLQLPVSAAVPATVIHLRNRIASAYFKVEPWLTPSAISGSGLASDVWCQPAMLYGRDEVVIGLLAREGGVNRVIDAWSGRRERMDTQPRGYWQGRMAMRPWNVFIAQILQFQCQLSGLFQPGVPVIQPKEDCDKLRGLLADARKQLEDLVKRYGEGAKKILVRETGKPTTKEIQSVSDEVQASFADLGTLSSKLAEVELGKGALPKQRMLLNAGFFELPPAGYLPVAPASAVEEQVDRMFGKGVHTHFHAVRSDEIAHLVEEAQHMERISLTRGLDDPKQIEQVEVFVPDGAVTDTQAASAGTWWKAALSDQAFDVSKLFLAMKAMKQGLVDGTAGFVEIEPAPPAAGKATGDFTSLPPNLYGLVRTEARDDGSYGFTFVVTGATAQESNLSFRLLHLRGGAQLYLAGDVSTDPFSLPVGGVAAVKAEFCSDPGTDVQYSCGTLTVLSVRPVASPGRERRLVQLDLYGSVKSAGKPSTSGAITLRLFLQRDGDAEGGQLTIDDATQNQATSPMLIAWEDNSHASISDQVSVADGQPAVRRQLATMDALPAMPAPTSSLGAAAMNALAALAEAIDDDAFLVRARRRLFPVLDAPKTQIVGAVHDWVMFRRARTHLCGPVCETTPPVTVMDFQVWHAKLAEKDASKLAAAIEQADAETLAKFASAFKRVGILRYRDDSVVSLETDNEVQAMWQDVPTGTDVTLGRVWEYRPTAGRAGQDQFRLRNMLQAIADKTKPPAAGTQALAEMPAPTGALADTAFSGGMLVVTSDVELPSRKAFIIYAQVEGSQHVISRDPKVSPQGTMQFDNNAPKGNDLATYLTKTAKGKAITSITLATIKAPDVGANERLKAVVSALKDAKLPDIQKSQVVPLSGADGSALNTININADDYDDIIFFEAAVLT